MTRKEQLKALLGALNPNDLRFTAAHHVVVNEIRTHFHETGQQPDTADYDEDECIEADIAAIEEILRETR